MLQGYDEEILDLCPVAAIDKEIDEADEANSKTVEILDKISDKLVAKPAPQVEGGDSPSSVGLSHMQQVNQATTVKPKLPKLTLEKFIGDVTTFQSFWEQFNSTVHENASIPETDKFKHLKVHIPPLTKFRPETPCGVKRSDAKNFRNRNCGFPVILRRYMAENSKNVSTSKSKISIFMIFPENIAN